MEPTEKSSDYLTYLKIKAGRGNLPASERDANSRAAW